MNNTATAWPEFLGFLALEVLLVIALAAGAQSFTRRATWRRLWWQTALVTVSGILLLELSGLGTFLAGRWFQADSLRRNGTTFIVRTFDPQTQSSENTRSPAAPSGVETGSGDVSPALAANSSVDDSVSPWTFPMPWMGCSWFVGSLIAVAWALGKRLALAVYFLRTPSLQDAVLEERLGRLASLMGWRRLPRLMESHRIHDPVAFGLIRPTICLPPRFSSDHSEQEQDAMLIHELAHLTARDPWWHGWADVITAVLWWHPAAWWMRRQFHRASELAADEASLLLERGPETLAACLVTLGRKLAQPQPLGWLGVDGSPFRSGLGRRVTRLFTLKDAAWKPIGGARRWLVQSVGPITVILIALFATGWVKLRAGAPFSAGDSWRNSILNQALRAVFTDASSASNASRETESLTTAALLEPKDDSLHALTTPSLSSSIVTADPPSASEASLDSVRTVESMETLPDSDSVQTVERVQDWIHPTKASQAVAQATVSAPTAPASPDPVGEVQANSSLEADAANQLLLETRWYKVDTNWLMTNLGSMQDLRDVPAGSATNASPSSTSPRGEAQVTSWKPDELFRFMTNAGVNLNPPRSIFFNDRLGMIMLRAPRTDLDLMENVLQMLNTAPPQVMLEVQLCEASSFGEGLDSLRQLLPSSASTASNQPITSILTETQFEEIHRLLEQRQGLDLLSAPKVTTLSGRQTQIKVVHVRYVVTDLDISEHARANQYQGVTVTPTNPPPAQSDQEGEMALIQPVAQPFELGPVIDIIPHVSADNSAIAMEVTVSIKEFLGYDQAQQFEAYARAKRKDKEVNAAETAPTPLPKFRTRQVQGSAVVANGQTLAMRGGSMVTENLIKDKVPVLGDIPLVGRLFKKEHKQSVTKELIIFITPRLIDPAGNLILLAKPKQ